MDRDKKKWLSLEDIEEAAAMKEVSLGGPKPERTTDNRNILKDLLNYLKSTRQPYEKLTPDQFFNLVMASYE